MYNRLGGLSLPRNNVVTLTDRLSMTLLFTVDVTLQVTSAETETKILLRLYN